jgi:hypothetical protein
LGGSIAESFVNRGKSCGLGRTKSHVDKRVEELKQLSNDVLGITANVLDIHELENANQLFYPNGDELIFLSIVPEEISQGLRYNLINRYSIWISSYGTR